MDLQRLWEVAGTVWMILPGVLLALVVWYAYRPKNRKRFEEDARIPFRDEPPTTIGRPEQPLPHKNNGGQ